MRGPNVGDKKFNIHPYNLLLKVAQNSFQHLYLDGSL